MSGEKGCQVPFCFQERWGGTGRVRRVDVGAMVYHAKRVPDTLSPLLACLDERVISPAELKLKRQTGSG